MNEQLKDIDKKFYLISDLTGQTLQHLHSSMVRLFDLYSNETIIIPLVNKKIRIKSFISQVKKKPGIVVYTIIDHLLSEYLEEELKKNNITFINALDHLIWQYKKALNIDPKINSTHQLKDKFNASYFKLIDAINFSHEYDDGKKINGIENADIILIGVSRTSKTPISHYLANRGLKVGNIPFFSLKSFPSLSQCTKSLIIGLKVETERLATIREQRMLSAGLKNKYNIDNKYYSIEHIKREMQECNFLFNQLKCSVIDVTNRSIEETSSIILRLLNLKNIN